MFKDNEQIIPVGDTKVLKLERITLIRSNIKENYIEVHCIHGLVAPVQQEVVYTLREVDYNLLVEGIHMIHD